MEEIQCLNCETSFRGVYCPHCGQPSKTKRLTVPTVIRDFLDALSDSDKGFLRTVIDLSQEPGEMMRDYRAGKRKRYLSAGKYSFFLIVIFTVFASYLESHFTLFESLTQLVETMEEGNFEGSFKIPSGEKNFKKMEPSKKKIKKPKEQLSDFEVNLFGKNIKKKVSREDYFRFARYLIPRYHATLFDYLKFLVILWIPVFSFFSFIFFWKSGYNFAEHITFNSFIYAHILLIYILFAPLYWVHPNGTMTTVITSTVAALFFLSYSYLQLFNKGRYRLLKVFFSLTFSFSAYLTLLSVLVVGLATYIFAINIEKL